VRRAVAGILLRSAPPFFATAASVLLLHAFLHRFYQMLVTESREAAAESA